MPMNLAPQYMEKVRRFHDNHPEAYAAEHAAFLHGTGLADEIVKQGAPELAHHPEIEQIGAMPKSEHARAVAALHDRESATGGENEETDSYLRQRAGDIKRGRR